ncbi:MAG: 4Fe-4S dicluster domain-containing protein [Coriobacteriia bacterium]
MGSYHLDARAFPNFIEALIRATRVVAPVAKRGAFVFGELESAENLRLDYDVTLLPPKKVFFPPIQDLVRFDGEAVSGCIDPVETILFGVHVYDVKGLDMTDFMFREGNADYNYLAQREVTTVVASNVQSVAPRSFWGSIGKEVEPAGHDAFLTKLETGYVLETRSPKGEALVASGAFREATAEETAAAARVNAEAMERCEERLPYLAGDIARRVRDSFGNEALWDSLAENCFSCGSCNTVCPTCYCFDVRDSWDLDQASGTRTRYWDACLTREFAAVTQAGGSTENFREHHSSRFRHRFMRKAAYLNEKLGGPACTGCGRCARACTSDLADPVRVITRIMEARA